MLNGFIYSLIGLFDLKETLLLVEEEEVTLGDDHLSRVQRLITQALDSLRFMIWIRFDILFDNDSL